MTPRPSSLARRSGRESGSTLIVVLWVSFGLVSLALYFANSMSFELRAADNRVASLAADQAIDGATRYITSVLSNLGTNGIVPDVTTYSNAAVPVGDSHFWLIGRDTNNPTGPGNLLFGLVDEASKLNLNRASSNQLLWLPPMTTDLLNGILDWRSTNGPGTTVSYYAMRQPPYQCKGSAFQTVEELRLVYGAYMDALVGEDVNRNGVLDPNENDDNHNGLLDPGLLEYVTVYSREPNPSTNADGTARINVSSLTVTSSDTTQLRSLLNTNFGTQRASEIIQTLGLTVITPAGGGGRGGPPAPMTTATVRFSSPLQFYIKSKMTSAEFAQIANSIRVNTNAYILGRVNVNTASSPVLACLLGGDITSARTLVDYRTSNPNSLTSIAWVVDALGQESSDALTALQAGDYLTTQSFQFTADIAALGPFGRGYRRVKFIFDTSSGAPQITYRQDLTHLGWALGGDVRQTWMLAKGLQ